MVYIWESAVVSAVVSFQGLACGLAYMLIGRRRATQLSEVRVCPRDMTTRAPRAWLVIVVAHVVPVEMTCPNESLLCDLVMENGLEDKLGGGAIATNG